MPSRSISERPRRSIAQAITTSNLRRLASFSISSSANEQHFPLPLVRSSKRYLRGSLAAAIVACEDRATKANQTMNTYWPIFTLIQASGWIFRSISRRRHVAQLTCELVNELGETFRQ